MTTLHCATVKGTTGFGRSIDRWFDGWGDCDAPARRDAARMAVSHDWPFLLQRVVVVRAALVVQTPWRFAFSRGDVPRETQVTSHPPQASSDGRRGPTGGPQGVAGRGRTHGPTVRRGRGVRPRGRRGGEPGRYRPSSSIRRLCSSTPSMSVSVLANHSTCSSACIASSLAGR